jgi:hypothetical protein
MVELAALVVQRLKKLTQSVHVEVQERAASLRKLLETAGLGAAADLPKATGEGGAGEEKDSDDEEGGGEGAEGGGAGGAGGKPPPIEPAELLELMSSLFTDPLGAVSAKAQVNGWIGGWVVGWVDEWLGGWVVGWLGE